MTVAGWISLLQKMPLDQDVLVRMSNYDSGDEMMATKPSIQEDSGCNGEDFVSIDMTDEDAHVDEVADAAIDAARKEAL